MMPSTRAARAALRALCACCPLALACAGPSPDGGDPSSSDEDAPSASADGTSDLDRAGRLARLLSTIAADSMEGRRTGSRGARLTARYLAAELARYGVEPGAPEGGFLQRVPLARTGGSSGGQRLVLPSPDVDFDTLDAGALLTDAVNVVGVIRGSDPAAVAEAVVIGAHFDHVGIGPPVDGDSIYTGADDDGTGTAAVLEIARDLASGRPPRRTVVVLLSTAEEAGMLGTHWYIRNPTVPLERTVADFQIEMIGRPDSLAGGFGRGWLTGYQRTTMGDQLAGAGSPIVPDPRPEMRFFFRSDNLPFAMEGIPAHTLSSYNMHSDYHQPSDEVDAVDLDHMAALVDAAVEAVRLLADGPTPQWKEGGRSGLPGG
jgi:hypothetical protein